MSLPNIKALFSNDVERPIEEVIKVDQTDEDIIKFEIDEYVVTDAIAAHYASILDIFNEAPNKPRDGVGVWVSGFFGSPRCSVLRWRTDRSSVRRPVNGSLLGRARRCRCCSSRLLSAFPCMQ